MMSRHGPKACRRLDLNFLHVQTNAKKMFLKSKAKSKFKQTQPLAQPLRPGKQKVTVSGDGAVSVDNDTQAQAQAGQPSNTEAQAQAGQPS